MTEERIRALPKIELHCHLDGSLSRAFIEERLGRGVSREELSVTNECKSLKEYLEKFSIPGACIMDEEGLAGAGSDVMKTLASENVIYGEIRFAPLLSVSEKMDTASVIEALIRGMEEGKATYGVEYGIIACAMRHHSLEENIRMFEVARRYLGKGICAVDLAGAEAQYPMEEFVDLFLAAKEMGLPYTIHAGECGRVENVTGAIELGARRIGHGIAMRGHSDVQALTKERCIGIEMCPISNMHTKAVPTPEEYPIREFLEAGVPVTINTDNRTVSDTSLTREFLFLSEHYGIGEEEILQMTRNAVEVAFADDDVKEALREKIRNAS